MLRRDLQPRQRRARVGVTAEEDRRVVEIVGGQTAERGAAQPVGVRAETTTAKAEIGRRRRRRALVPRELGALSLAFANSGPEIMSLTFSAFEIVKV